MEAIIKSVVLKTVIRRGPTVAPATICTLLAVHVHHMGDRCGARSATSAALNRPIIPCQRQPTALQCLFQGMLFVDIRFTFLHRPSEQDKVGDNPPHACCIGGRLVST